jgi:hypothetical protein
VNRRSMWSGVAVLLAITVGGMACGSDKKAAAPDPHGLRASATEVAAGLGKLDSLVNQIGLAASADAKAAKNHVKEIEEIWAPIEGTIRENDKDAYIRFEDDFAAIEKGVDAGDATRTQSSTADVSAAVKAYLAKYPG